jgi:hypothetical protein
MSPFLLNPNTLILMKENTFLLRNKEDIFELFCLLSKKNERDAKSLFFQRIYCLSHLAKSFLAGLCI